MASKNCLIAWVIPIVFVLLLISQVAASDLVPLFGQKSARTMRELRSSPPKDRAAPPEDFNHHARGRN